VEALRRFAADRWPREIFAKAVKRAGKWFEGAPQACSRWVRRQKDVGEALVDDKRRAGQRHWLTRMGREVGPRVLSASPRAAGPGRNNGMRVPDADLESRGAITFSAVGTAGSAAPAGRLISTRRSMTTGAAPKKIYGNVAIGNPLDADPSAADRRGVQAHGTLAEAETGRKVTAASVKVAGSGGFYVKPAIVRPSQTAV
jgi:hypothetical protein